MKQILFTLFLFISLSINAQIQRTFFGLELCKATKQDVKEMLQSKGIQSNDYNVDNINIQDVTFGGITWDNILFQFDGDVFYSVVFGKKGFSLNKENVKKEVKSIEDILREKYSHFLMVDKEEHLIFCDLKTMASSSFTDVNGIAKAYGLTYSDMATLSKISQKHKDEF